MATGDGGGGLGDGGGGLGGGAGELGGGAGALGDVVVAVRVHEASRPLRLFQPPSLSRLLHSFPARQSLSPLGLLTCRWHRFIGGAG